MKLARVIERGDGPRIEGTRITVYTIFEYLRAGDTRDAIAAELFISSAQVQAAIDYIREHEAEVNAEYERIMARIRRGNPPEIEAKLQASREKLKELREDPEKFAAWRASRDTAGSNGAPTPNACVVERSDGPRIEGTRITVYTILEYLRAGDTRDAIAAELFLSSAQVQAAMDYIRDHEAEVNEEFERIMARIRKGNPPDVLVGLEGSRKKLAALRERLVAEGRIPQS